MILDNDYKTEVDLGKNSKEHDENLLNESYMDKQKDSIHEQEFEQLYAKANNHIEENLASVSDAHHTNPHTKSETIIKREASLKTVEHHNQDKKKNFKRPHPKTFTRQTKDTCSIKKQKPVRTDRSRGREKTGGKCC